nr:hypothetical protein [uncultured Flavobacterium sp.]
MLFLNRLYEYSAEIKAQLLDEEGNPIFDYQDSVIDDSELSKILKDKIKTGQSVLVSVCPDHTVIGGEDNSKFTNHLIFFVLEKTNYNDTDRDQFKQIFVRTQMRVYKLIQKFLEDKSEGSGAFCNILKQLTENSINVTPVWKKEQCNGWMITLNFDTNFVNL